MKARRFTALLAACTLSMGMTGGPLAAPVRAAAAPVTLSAESRTLLVDTGEKITLSGLRVVLGSETFAGTAVQWAADAGLIVADGILTATAKGVHRVTVSKGNAFLEIYVAAKAAADKEYVLCEESFDGGADGQLPAGWKRIEGSACVQGGKLRLSRARVLLPSWLEAFGDYQVEADMQITEYTDTARWSSLMFRIQNGNYPYYQMCVRVDAAQNNGVEFAERTPQDGWNVMKTGSFTEALAASKSYRLSARAEGDRIVESINGATVIDATLSGLRKTGGVGLQSNNNTSLFDNVRVVVPAEKLPDPPKAVDAFKPETSLVNPPAVLTAPATAEELKAMVEAAERPSHILLAVNDSLQAAGMALADALKAIDEACIPVLAVESETAADGTAALLKSGGYVDAIVLSGNPDLVKRARAVYPLIGGAVKFSDTDTPAAMTAKTSAAGAVILVLPAEKADRETVAYLQKRFLSVWAEAPAGLDTAGAVGLTAAGVNGIIASQPSVCYDAYRVFSGKAYLSRRPFIIGHRGVPSLVPENTLESAQKVYELGAGLVECDIYLTTDNQIVILHDGSLERTTDGTGHIESYTLAQLKQFKANKGNAAQYPDARIPTLEEYFSYFKGKDMVIVIEIKSAKAEIVAGMKELIDKYDIADQCVVISFNMGQLKRTAQLIPELPLGFLTQAYGDEDMTISIDSLLRETRTAGTAYSPYFDKLGSGFIRALGLRGIPTSVWTIDSAFLSKTLLSNGVSHVTTNRAQDILPKIGTVEALQDSYSLSVGDKLTMKAKAVTLAGEEEELEAELIPVSGGEHLSVNGSAVTGISDGTVKAILRVPMDAQEDIYMFTRVVTIKVGSGGSDTGEGFPWTAVLAAGAGVLALTAPVTAVCVRRGRKSR